MARTQTMSINEFMSGDYKSKKKVRSKYKVDKKHVMAFGTALLPLVAVSQMPVFAMHNPVNVEVVPAANQHIADKTLDVIAHALDPVVELLVAISLPIASVIMIGACFFFMFGNSEKAWSLIMNSGLGYILIQLSPLFLKILKEIGNAV